MPNTIEVSPQHLNTISVDPAERTLSVVGRVGTILVTSKFVAAETISAGGNKFLPGPSIINVGSTSYVMPGWTIRSFSSQAVKANEAYAVPIYTPVDLKVDQIRIRVTSGSGGATIRLALYDNDDDTSAAGFRPGSLQEDFGTMDASSSGFKSIAISPSITLNGWYWLLIGPSTNLSLSGLSGNDDAPVGGADQGKLIPLGNYLQFDPADAADWITNGYPDDLTVFTTSPEGFTDFMPLSGLRVDQS